MEICGFENHERLHLPVEHTTPFDTPFAIPDGEEITGYDLCSKVLACSDVDAGALVRLSSKARRLERGHPANADARWLAHKLANWCVGLSDKAKIKSAKSDRIRDVLGPEIAISTLDVAHPVSSE